MVVLMALPCCNPRLAGNFALTLFLAVVLLDHAEFSMPNRSELHSSSGTSIITEAKDARKLTNNINLALNRRP